MKQITKNILLLTLMSTGCSPLIGMHFLQKAKDTVAEQVKKHPYIYGSLALGATAYTTYKLLYSDINPKLITKEQAMDLAINDFERFKKLFPTLPVEIILHAHATTISMIRHPDVQKNNNLSLLKQIRDYLHQNSDYCLREPEIRKLIASTADPKALEESLQKLTFSGRNHAAYGVKSNKFFVGFYDIFYENYIQQLPVYDWKKPVVLYTGKSTTIDIAFDALDDKHFYLRNILEHTYDQYDMSCKLVKKETKPKKHSDQKIKREDVQYTIAGNSNSRYGFWSNEHKITIYDEKTQTHLDITKDISDYNLVQNLLCPTLLSENNDIVVFHTKNKEDMVDTTARYVFKKVKDQKQQLLFLQQQLKNQSK